MVAREVRILILCKTYPSPSATHAETSCVAGVDDKGAFVRLFPVPFRLIEDSGQFKKWQWVQARIEKSTKDHRLESHRLFVDTIKPEGVPLSTADRWVARREWLDRLRVFDDFPSLEAARLSSGSTLGILRPEKIVGLDITPAERPGWTQAELDKLTQLQRQGGLFDTDTKSISTLRKVPFDFHYRYRDRAGTEFRHKIVDWEVGALFWNVRRRHGQNWEEPFRAKIEQELPRSDLMFLMGTIHRFPDQWLIASLLYPPKRPPDRQTQQSLPL